MYEKKNKQIVHLPEMLPEKKPIDQLSSNKILKHFKKIVSNMLD